MKDAVALCDTNHAIVTTLKVILERRNSHDDSAISPNSVAFGTDCVKVVEDTPILSATEM